MDCSPPGSPARGIFQARILEWGFPCPPPGDLPDPGIEPEPLRSPVLASGFFTSSATITVTWLDSKQICFLFTSVPLMAGVG